jgi:endonuclease YncB( thermonuclease family)
MTFKVIEVTDGDTFVVSPNWEWNGESGNAVRPVGYNAPEQGDPGFDEAKEKL